MTNDHQEDFGVMRFVPYGAFEDPNAGAGRLSRLERLDQLLAVGPPPRPPGVGDWPRVHTAIHRDGFYVLEASAPNFTAMLRFCPERPDAGDYEIHHRPHGGVEKGRTLRLQEVAVGEKDARVSMLKPFPVRYLIVTGADDRARTQLAWLVGLTTFRSVDEKEQTQD